MPSTLPNCQGRSLTKPNQTELLAIDIPQNKAKEDDLQQG